MRPEILKKGTFSSALPQNALKQQNFRKKGNLAKGTELYPWVNEWSEWAFVWLTDK